MRPSYLLSLTNQQRPAPPRRATLYLQSFTTVIRDCRLSSSQLRIGSASARQQHRKCEPSVLRGGRALIVEAPTQQAARPIFSRCGSRGIASIPLRVKVEAASILTAGEGRIRRQFGGAMRSDYLRCLAPGPGRGGALPEKWPSNWVRV